MKIEEIIEEFTQHFPAEPGFIAPLGGLPLVDFLRSRISSYGSEQYEAGKKSWEDSLNMGNDPRGQMFKSGFESGRKLGREEADSENHFLLKENYDLRITNAKLAHASLKAKEEGRKLGGDEKIEDAIEAAEKVNPFILRATSDYRLGQELRHPELVKREIIGVLLDMLRTTRASSSSPTTASEEKKPND